ncbi:MAG: ornithine cyclodeaminase family protein [bacterium]
MTGTLLLAKTDVAQCLDMVEDLALLESAFRAQGEGRAAMPPKITLDMSGLDIPNWMNAMPAYLTSAEMCGIKWAGGFIDNPTKHSLPYVMATLILNDPQTGLAVAIMDAADITAVRTGGSAAIAARYLARSDARVVALVGCGTQATVSLEALNLLFDLEEVRASDVLFQARDRLARRATELGMQGRAVDSNREALEGADIILTATTSDEPLVMKDWVDPGAVIIDLGSYQELDDALTRTADKLIVDHRVQTEHRGELAHLFQSGRMTQDDIYCELGEIIAGLVPGRESDDEIIVVIPIGMASMDVAIGAAVLKRAQDLGLGQRFDFLA